MNCRLLTVKEVRSGSPSCVAVNDSMRAQMTSTDIFGQSKVHSPLSPGWGQAKRIHSALIDKEVCFLFLSEGKKLKVQQHQRTMVLPRYPRFETPALLFLSLSLAKELLFGLLGLTIEKRKGPARGEVSVLPP